MDLRERIIDALGDDALTAEELAARLDVTPGETIKTIRLASSFLPVGERFVYVPALLDGTSWSVHVDADDAASDLAPGGFIRMRPHLGVIGWWLIDDDVAALRPDGTRIGILDTDGADLDGVDTDIVTCAPGWLDEVAGGWAVFSVSGGAVTIAPSDPPPDVTPEQAAAVAAAFETAVEADSLAGIDGTDTSFEIASAVTVLHSALYADHDVFATGPNPPIEDLVTAAGFEYHDEMVVKPGFDWDAYRAWQTRLRMRIMHRLGGEQIDLAARLIDTCVRHREHGDDAFGEPSERADTGLALARALDDHDVMITFTTEAIGEAVSISDLLAFTEAVDRHARAAGSTRNDGVTALVVRCHVLLDDEPGAIELLDAAVDSATRQPDLLHLAAELAADRGRAAEARQLLVRMGVEPYRPADDWSRAVWDDGPSQVQLLLAEVEPYARPRTRRDIGRNAPCPCGSGKKYKACHLGKEEVPLDDRAPWLYEKCSRYVRTRASGQLDDVAEDLSRFSPEAFDHLRDTPVAIDLVLHEYGIDQEFLTTRGPVLPEDEQLLAAQWALVDRAVYEVDDVRRRPDGGELRLRDLASGDIVVVSQVHVGDQLRPGLVLLGRPLPVGDTNRAFSGFWPLDHSRANAAIDAIAADDPDALFDLLAAGLGPPTVTNTDGQPIEWYRTTWAVDADPDAVGAVLSAAGLDGPEPGAEPGTSRWNLVRDSANQRDTVIATIEVGVGEDGTELAVEVNSEERADELDTLVVEWFPDAECIGDELLDPGDELLDPDDELLDPDDELLDPDEIEPPGEMPSPDDPALREALDAFILEYEEQWLDDAIPALGGRTPREAVQDPVGREEVLHLLATFPEPEPGHAGMSPTRLRNALGL